MMKENTTTPMSMIAEAVIRSKSVFGFRSPYPIVERVVNAKYVTSITDSKSEMPCKKTV